jgi:hypothetical protein
MYLPRVVTKKSPNENGNQHKNNTQQELQHQNGREVFGDKMVILSYIFIVEIGDSEIKQDVQ